MCSETDVFCTVSLPNMLLATAACNFSTWELQKVLRTWRVLYIFTLKCAFCHSGVQFLISPLTTWLRTRRFKRPTFPLTRHTKHKKNTACRDFSNIWRGCIFFLLTFALVHLFTCDLTACPICFSTLHIVGSLLFKLPSMMVSVKARGCPNIHCSSYQWIQAVAHSPKVAIRMQNSWINRLCSAHLVPGVVAEEVAGGKAPLKTEKGEGDDWSAWEKIVSEIRSQSLWDLYS